MSIGTLGESQPHLYDTPSEEESSFDCSLDTESTLLPLQHVQTDSVATIAAKDMELQKLSRELEKAKFKLDWSERRRQLMEKKTRDRGFRVP